VSKAGLLLFLLACGACRTSVYRAPVRADARATYEALRRDGENGIAAEDEALWRCELAVAALEVGDERAAFDALHKASKIMGTLESTKGEVARAVLGEESTKTWKGDPYERCMNCLYKGLLYWRRGELDNASACFRRGLLADAVSEAGDHQRDFAALSFLLGWVSTLRGKEDQAKRAFDEARRFSPRNPHADDPRPDRFNILIIADIGRGPLKFADGPGGHVARFMPRNHADGGIAVYVDGRKAGFSYPLTDLYKQATTRGEQALDGIRAGKAFFKGATKAVGIITASEGLFRGRPEMVAIGIGLMLLSEAIRPRADTRHWALLPAQIHCLPVRITPGPHTIRVRALDRKGRPISNWERTFKVDVRKSDTLFWFRTGRQRDIFALLSHR